MWSLKYQIVVNGKNVTSEYVPSETDKVTSQYPPSGTEIDRSWGVVIFYVDKASADSDMVAVPNIIGKTSVAANQWLVNEGLNVRIEGVNNPYASSETSAPVAIKQSIEPGTLVKRGSVITVEFRYLDKDEEFDYLD